jgi:dTDP-glucose 4,6-dehydratase
MTLGHAKRAAELLCTIYGSRGATRIKIARCFSFVGPQLPLDIHYAIGNFIADAIAGRPITVTGTGMPVRSYLYMSDLVTWLITILLRGEPLRPYNVGSANGMTIREVAELVAVSSGLSVKLAGPARDTLGAIGGDGYVPSTSRARLELNLAETVFLSSAIVKTVTFQAG